jgi:hypothetical protein
MALSEKTKVYLKYALANQDVADEVISSLENEPTSDAALAAHVAAPNPHPQYDTSAEVQAKVDAHAIRVDNPHNVTKAQVGLENVPNVNATQRSNHTGTQLASTISDFGSAAQSAVVVQTITNGDTAHAPSGDAVHDALDAEASARSAVANRVTDIENDYGMPNGLATLDSSGKILASALPSNALEYKGTWDASTNTPLLQNGSLANSPADAGHIYRVSVAGTVNFGAGNITFSIGDDVILSEALLWERAPGGSLVISVNGYQGDVELNSEDILLTTSVASAADVQHALENLEAAITDTMDAHVAAADPHPQYETSTEVQSKVDAHANLTNNPHSVTKDQVGLGNVPNVDATARANHTGTQLAVTISDFSSTAQDAVASVLTNTSTVAWSYNPTTHAISADVVDGSITNAKLAGSINATKISSGLVSNSEFDTLDGINTGVSIQNQLDGKEPTITGAATTITSTNLTASRALASDALGKVAVSAVTATELGYLSGTTSAVQTQLGTKANLAGGNTFTGKQVMTAGSVDPGLNVGSVALDPTNPANGDVWYNSATNDVKFRQGGVTIIERNILNRQVIPAGTTTYTPTAGTKYIDVILIGAGGGGGGVSGAANQSAGGGGGGGGAALYIYVALTGAASYTCSIGTGGIGGTGGAGTGTTGGSTSLTIGGTTYTAAGGLGGIGQATGTALANTLGGAGGATPTLGQINVGGQPGEVAIRLSGTVGTSGRGANSAFGSGGASLSEAGGSSIGNAGTGFGAGGGGAFSTTAGNRVGGAGSNGTIIITEYA